MGQAARGRPTSRGHRGRNPLLAGPQPPPRSARGCPIAPNTTQRPHLCLPEVAGHGPWPQSRRHGRPIRPRRESSGGRGSRRHPVDHNGHTVHPRSTPTHGQPRLVVCRLRDVHARVPRHPGSLPHRVDVVCVGRGPVVTLANVHCRGHDGRCWPGPLAATRRRDAHGACRICIPPTSYAVGLVTLGLPSPRGRPGVVARLQTDERLLGGASAHCTQTLKRPTPCAAISGRRGICAARTWKSRFVAVLACSSMGSAGTRLRVVDQHHCRRGFCRASRATF